MCIGGRNNVLGGENDGVWWTIVQADNWCCIIALWQYIDDWPNVNRSRGEETATGGPILVTVPMSSICQ